jgi:hypothetical protein
MKRLSALAITLLATPALLVGLAGCGGGDKPTTSAPPTAGAPTSGATPATGSVSPGPTGSAAAVAEFTVDGAGPYELGTTLAALQSANLLSSVATGGTCPQNTTARGTGTWADLELSFHPDGALYLAVNKSPAVPTPSGAWVGTSLDDLKKIYKGLVTREVSHGADAGFVVRTNTGRGILFSLDISKSVVSMTAGDGNYLITTFQSGEQFC